MPPTNVGVRRHRRTLMTAHVRFHEFNFNSACFYNELNFINETLWKMMTFFHLQGFSSVSTSLWPLLLPMSL